MTGIVILNWNGCADTIECIESVYMMSSDFYVLVADNGSTDGSVSEIGNYLRRKGIAQRTVARGEALTEAPKARECIIYDIGENLGFAKGNNEGLRLIGRFMPDYMLLLNNDTIVEPDFLDRLTDFAGRNADVAAMTPLICYNGRRDTIWNCGGRMRGGFRKYHYADAPLESLGHSGHLEVSFLTGCALFFVPSAALRADGGIFTERFFFGEEDFNFCMRMNREGRRMACVLTSKIYHKVSASTSQKGNIGKIYIHYLNRFIDIRLNKPGWFYLLWSAVNMAYVPLMLMKNGYGTRTAISTMARVARDAGRKDAVSRTDFIKALNRRG